MGALFFLVFFCLFMYHTSEQNIQIFRYLVFIIFQNSAIMIFMTNKDMLKTSGYPRSGNSYLNQALNLMYYPEENVNINLHSIEAIKSPSIKIVPFRNPIDAISSWYTYPRSIWAEKAKQAGFPAPSTYTVKQAVGLYLEFHKTILENIDNFCLMDFEKFTSSIDYIKSQVYTKIGITSEVIVSDLDIKRSILESGRESNLPRNNKEELEASKTVIQETDGFDICLSLYDQLKSKG